MTQEYSIMAEWKEGKISVTLFPHKKAFQFKFVVLSSGLFPVVCQYL